MSNIKIFVSQRIDFEAETVENEVFVPVNCGATYLDESRSIAGDNTGENISARRNSFCELTVQYWAWKNVKADYYGICHYRRYFSFADEAHREDNYTNVLASFIDGKSRERYCLDDIEQIRKVVSGNDILATTAFDVSKVGYKNIENQYVQQEYLEAGDMEILRSAMNKLHPEYVATLENTLHSKQFYPCNMFIMKREVFEEYCAWLFSVLFEVERHLDMSEANSDRLRAIGHIGERLLTVFINHKKQQNAKIRILQRVLFRNPSRLERIHKLSDEHIPVVFSSNRKYMPYLYVSILSMLNTVGQKEKLDIIILHNELVPEDMRLLRQLVENDDRFSLRFYDVSCDIEDIDFRANAHISVDTFYRLFIPRICEEYDKIIYLDSDLLICHDVRELYDSISDEKFITATPDPDYLSQCYGDKEVADYTEKVLGIHRPIRYFQAGVMAFNLKCFRERYVLADLIDFALSHDFKYLDQDIMNSFFHDDVHFISLEWNVLMDSFELRQKNILKHAPAHICQAYIESRKKPKIIHYAGGDKPWHNPVCDFAGEFWEIARRTPVYERMIFDLANERAKETAVYLAQRRNYIKRIVCFILPSDKEKRRRMKQKLNNVVSVFAPQGSGRREWLRRVYRIFR